MKMYGQIDVFLTNSCRMRRNIVQQLKFKNQSLSNSKVVSKKIKICFHSLSRGDGA